MYYVNQEQIDKRISFVPTLIEACGALQSAIKRNADSEAQTELLLQLAQERILYLAIEIVTDVGSLLIDAFMMRDASSYDDIIEILAGEGVFASEVADTLMQLVKLRRPLTQEYTELERYGIHPLIEQLPRTLQQFAEAVPAFIRKEMI